MKLPRIRIDLLGPIIESSRLLEVEGVLELTLPEVLLHELIDLALVAVLVG
jgi:hypothetical protein